MLGGIFHDPHGCFDGLQLVLYVATSNNPKVSAGQAGIDAAQVAGGEMNDRQ